MVAALGPPDIGMRGARWVNRLGFPYGFRFCPASLNRWFWRRQAYGKVELGEEERLGMVLKGVEANRKGMTQREYDAIRDEEFQRMALRSTAEGFRQGYDGVLLDGKLCCLDFGFRVEDFREDLKVQLWYGKRDVFVPPNHGVQLAKRLGGRVELHLEDETHVSLTVYRRKEILENMLRAM